MGSLGLFDRLRTSMANALRGFLVIYVQFFVTPYNLQFQFLPTTWVVAQSDGKLPKGRGDLGLREEPKDVVNQFCRISS